MLVLMVVMRGGGNVFSGLDMKVNCVEAGTGCICSSSVMCYAQLRSMLSVLGFRPDQLSPRSLS